MIDIIKSEINDSIRIKQAVVNDFIILDQLQKLANKAIESLQNGGKIIFCGNGGSFADAQHLSAEFVSRLRFDRSPLSSIALGTNSSTFSAVANDYRYDKVFTRELIALCKSDDVFIPITTSGNSPNILDAVSWAKENNIYTIGLTGGNGGKLAALCDCIIVPSNRTEKIQEVHIMLGHIFCHIVEDSLFKK